MEDFTTELVYIIFFLVKFSNLFLFVPLIKAFGGNKIEHISATLINIDHFDILDFIEARYKGCDILGIIEAPIFYIFRGPIYRVRYFGYYQGPDTQYLSIFIK